MTNSSFDPLHLVNTYGAVGRVTRRRYEVVIEGTAADSYRRVDVWQEYQFSGKPGDPLRRPRQVAPYHLRLDWLLWFVPLSRGADQTWLVALLGKLLDHDRPTGQTVWYEPLS
ncbi:MAG: lipase maturation factor family protein [Actinomycetota bacterium]|nr:lipase maturation factor family protein [Actinomycetota bacterium]